MSVNLTKNSAIIALAAGIVGVVILAGLISSRSQVQPVSVKTVPPTPLETAQAYYDQGDYEQAIPLFKTYLEKSGPAGQQAPLVRDLLVSSYWQTKDYKKAFDLLSEVAKANPGDTDSVYRLGLLAGELGEHDKASKYFAQAIAAKPGQAQYHTGFAETLAKLNKHEEAREQWQIVMSLTPADSPSRATIHGKIGDTYAARNLPDSAAAEFEAGLAIEPDNQYLKQQLAAVSQ